VTRGKNNNRLTQEDGYDQALQAREANLTQQENTDAGVRHLYARINIIKANYENNITYNFLRSQFLGEAHMSSYCVYATVGSAVSAVLSTPSCRRWIKQSAFPVTVLRLTTLANGRLKQIVHTAASRLTSVAAAGWLDGCFIVASVECFTRFRYF